MKAEEALQRVASGVCDINEVVEPLMKHCQRQVKSWLSVNPTHGYLFDDLVSTAYLSMVTVCKSMTPNTANVRYLNTSLRHAFVELVRCENTIIPPRDAGGEYEYPTREYPDLDSMEVENTDIQHIDLMDFIGSFQWTDRQHDVLFARANGYTMSEIAESLDLTARQVRHSLDQIKSRLKRKLNERT